MSAPPLFLAAAEREQNVVPVSWRIGTVQAKGVVHVVLPSELPVKDEMVSALAEVTALRFLADSKQAGASIRHHEVCVTQPMVRDVLSMKADESELIPWSRHLYLIADAAKVKVKSGTWAEGVEVNPEKISVVVAGDTSWPSGYCQVLQQNVGISRHALDRFIERCAIRNDYMHAFNTMVKWLGSKNLRVVPHEEVRKTNPGMIKDKNTIILLQKTTKTALVIIKEPSGPVLVTVHPHYQEFVPTFVAGRVEYRRNK